MTLDQFLLIVRFQSVLFFLGAVLSLIRFKVRQPYLRLLGLAMFCSVLGNNVSAILRHYKINPNYSGTAFYICIIPLICAIYYYAMNRRGKITLVFISAAYVAFAFINVLFIQKSSINSYTLVLQSIITIALSLYYFYWLLQELPAAQLHRLPMFWINSAYIIYNSANLFLFVFTSYLVNVLNNRLLVYWTLHNIIGIIQASMMIVALWMDLQNIKSLSSSPSAQ